MPTTPSFVAHALELFSGVGEVRARGMFGGYLLSLDGISIGLIDDDRVYLRADEQLRPKLEAAGSTPFTYPSKNGRMTMKTYWSLPDEALDDADAAVRWGRLAAQAAARLEAAKARGKRPRAAKKPKARAVAKPTPKRRRSRP